MFTALLVIALQAYAMVTDLSEPNGGVADEVDIDARRIEGDEDQAQLVTPDTEITLGEDKALLTARRRRFGATCFTEFARCQENSDDCLAYHFCKYRDAQRRKKRVFGRRRVEAEEDRALQQEDSALVPARRLFGKSNCFGEYLQCKYVPSLCSHYHECKMQLAERAKLPVPWGLPASGPTLGRRRIEPERRRFLCLAEYLQCFPDGVPTSTRTKGHGECQAYHQCIGQGYLRGGQGGPGGSLARDFSFGRRRALRASLAEPSRRRMYSCAMTRKMCPIIPSYCNKPCIEGGWGR